MQPQSKGQVLFVTSPSLGAILVLTVLIRNINKVSLVSSLSDPHIAFALLSKYVPAWIFWQGVTFKVELLLLR